MKYLILFSFILLGLLTSPTSAMQEGGDSDGKRPKKGWICESVTDIGKRDAACDDCGTMIKYVHHMKHKDCEESPEVGCCCAARLEDDETRAKRRQDNFLKPPSNLKWEPFIPLQYGHYMLYKGETRKTSPHVQAFKDNEDGRYYYNVHGKSIVSFDTMAQAQKAAIDDYLGFLKQ